MEDSMACPECRSPYGYATGSSFMCPECGHEWMENEALVPETGLWVIDANGTRLLDGDSVIVLKNLPVKGMPQPVKAGTKVKNIKLNEGNHNIDCRIEGFGQMALKSEFVRKA